MARYSAELQRTSSTSASLGTITADATRPRRGRVFYLCFGSEAAPADQAILWKVQRCTAAGTSTAVSLFPLETAEAATEADAGENHTVEPTYTANAFLLSVSLNQKATFQWRAPAGDELVYPATASNGVGIHTPTITSGTPVITASVHLREE